MQTIIHINATPHGMRTHATPAEAIEWLTTAWTDLGGPDITILATYGEQDFIGITEAVYPTALEDDAVTAYRAYLQRSLYYTVTVSTALTAEESSALFFKINGGRK